MKLLSLVLMSSLGLAVSGCSSSEDAKRDPTYKVTGTVTLQGKPVAGADITFFNTTANRSAFGRTNDAGRYELTTFKANDGAVAGKSDVTIVLIPPIPSTPAMADTESDDYAPPELGQSTMPPAPKSTLPARYADRATSGLIAVVNADEENVIDFDLLPQS